MSKPIESTTTVTTVNEKERKHRKKRLSLPNEPTTDFNKTLRTTQSFNKKIIPVIHTIEPIPEVDGDDDQVVIRKHEMRNGLNRSSQISTTSKKSTSSKTNTISYDNGGFELEGSGTNLKRAHSKTSLSPSAIGRESESARSSTRNSSANSITQVQREQYCCFSRWSPCEKKLASCIAILGTVILILVVVVGILAGGKDPNLNNKERFMHF